MKTKTLEYYDWIEDVGPVILSNLNELLVADGIQPLIDLRGGTLVDGKWGCISKSNDYRNYWHVYLELFGEGLSNDSYQSIYVPNPDSDEEWEWYYNKAKEFCRKERSNYDHTDPNWARHLVTAVRKMFKENIPFNDEEDCKHIVFWWCW